MRGYADESSKIHKSRLNVILLDLKNHEIDIYLSIGPGTQQVQAVIVIFNQFVTGWMEVPFFSPRQNFAINFLNKGSNKVYIFILSPVI